MPRHYVETLGRDDVPCRKPNTPESGPSPAPVRPHAARATALALTASSIIAACTPVTAHRPPQQQSASQTFGAESTGQISVYQPTNRPVITTVVRSGDPSAAVAASVLTDGDSLASTALAALVETRLQTAGVAAAGTRADRDGYRVFALVERPEDGAAFVRALHEAMSKPVAAGSEESAVAKKRLDALRSRPLDSPALLPVVRCTGELSALPSDPWFDPTRPDGAARLEQLRRTSHGHQRVSLAVVGSSALTARVVQALDASPAWTSCSLPQDPWPEQDRITAFARAGGDGTSAQLFLAIRVPGAFNATTVAERSAQLDSPLLARVGASHRWQVSRISATVRPRGACVSLALDRTPGMASTGSLETDAARVAALVVNELETDLSEVRADGSVAGRQVLRATDPREAASLAAWWTQASRLGPGPDRLAIALGLPASGLAPDSPARALDTLAAQSEQRFASAFRSAQTAWAHQVVQSNVRVENGQGELWLLAASPCSVLAEIESDAGSTALAALAATQSSGTANGVTLEPWVSQDGVGVLAHAAANPGEGAHALAGRIADAAAHALIHQRISDSDLSRARASILPLIDGPNAPFHAGVGALARALVPGRPSWLVPFGLRPRVVEAGSAAVDLRWSALADSPIRVAVLANVDDRQARAAVRALDRWIVRTEARSRSCEPFGSPAPATAAHVTLDAVAAPAGALLGFSVPSPDAKASAMLHLLAECLGGTDGWLARSLASFGGRITARARVLGGQHLSSLVIELRGSDAQLDAALQQVRGTLDRLAKGAATPGDLDRAARNLGERERAAQLDPRARLVSLWRNDTAPRPTISLGDWNRWMATALAAESVSSVRVKASGVPTTSADPEGE